MAKTAAKKPSQAAIGKMVDQLVNARQMAKEAKKLEDTAKEFLLPLSLKEYRSQTNVVVASDESQMRLSKDLVIENFGVAGYQKCLVESCFVKLTVQKTSW